MTLFASRGAGSGPPLKTDCTAAELGVVGTGRSVVFSCHGSHRAVLDSAGASARATSRVLVVVSRSAGAVIHAGKRDGVCATRASRRGTAVGGPDAASARRSASRRCSVPISLIFANRLDDEGFSKSALVNNRFSS